jgi:hypothetical protein
VTYYSQPPVPVARRPVIRRALQSTTVESLNRVLIDRQPNADVDVPPNVRYWTLAGDYRVARAAFEEAVKRRPGRIITLRQKTRLLADSRHKH